MRGSPERECLDDDDDSSTCSDSTAYVPYRARPEWADIEPLSIRSESHVMDIRYTQRFEECFGYLRALLQKDELSERALNLTADCIELQRSNFTVWYYRRRILSKLTHHLQNELAFIEKSMEEEPKNYQVWHHRKTIVEWLKDPSQEKALTATILAIDSKNYHSWQHRQWVVKEYNLWSGELEFTEDEIEADIRNNSAWNHRFFVIKETRHCDNEAAFYAERTFVLEKIQKSPKNESSWSYLRGLLKLANDAISTDQVTMQFCKQLGYDPDNSSPHLYAFMIDSISERLFKLEEKLSSQTKQDLKKQAIELCSKNSVSDKVRSKYWAYNKIIFEQFKID